MAGTVHKSQPAGIGSRIKDHPGRVSRVAPILIWASVGAFCLVLQLVIYGRWIMSPDFKSVALGPDPMPETVRIAMRAYDVLSLIAIPLTALWFARGIWRTGKLDSVRLLMLGWVSAYWLDPWLDFLRPMYTYNALAFNRGCWCNFIPGWSSPHGATIAEPLIIDGSAYFNAFTFAAVVALTAMRASARRWPNIGTAALTLIAFSGVWVSMGLLDIVVTRFLGFDAWPGSIQAASFWGGQYIQFPIYEFILFPAPFVACAFLLYKAAPDGTTLLERGLDRLSLGTAGRATLRILAFVAFCNLLNAGYTTAMGVHALVGDPWPSNMPSWLADGQDPMR